MKAARYAWTFLFLAAGARVALAVGKPPPGANAAIEGKTEVSAVTIGLVVVAAVAIATGIWWYLTHAQKDKSGK